MRVVAALPLIGFCALVIVSGATAEEPNDRAMAVRTSLKSVEERAPVLKVFDTGEAPKELAAFRPGKVEILAISSWRVPNPAAVMEMLGVTKSDRFHLLVDDTHRSFRDYGCFNSKPMHGLFLIDGEGVIR